MDADAAARVVALFEERGQLDRIDHVDAGATRACFARGKERLSDASVLSEAQLWELMAFTTAYDAYRTAADAVVLALGYRVPATPGGHRNATDIAHAAVEQVTDAFAPAAAERFRQGRHESEYCDPARPVDKTAGDTAWALELAKRAVDAVGRSLSADRG